MPRRIAAPRRLRRRLTVAFVLVAAVSAGALASGSYLLVRQARLGDSASRAVEQTELHIEALRSRLPRRAAPAAVRAVISSFGTASSTVAIVDGVTVPSISLGRGNIPGQLIRDVVRRGFVGYQRTHVGGTPYVVAGSRVPGHDVEIYSFFDEGPLQRDLAKLRLILLSGWAAVVLLAAGVGFVLARRTLAPVAAASDAARLMAEGLLQTRLPVAGDDEFGAWAASFNEMAQALESKIAALSEARDRERRFTSDVSHELRTPLAALVGEASLLRDHLDGMPPEARRPAELLIADVGRLRRMVEDLMEISRFDAGQEAVRIEPVDVGAVVRQTLRARGWESRVEVHGGGLVLQTDRRRLERIVGNLVGNAVEHGGDGAAVSVTVGGGGERALIEVADAGPGIAPEDLPHLFDRFYKADASRSSPGSGLGLGIAMENARLLGGDIEVRSMAGSGSTFTVVLPVTEPLPGGESGVSSTTDDEGTSNRREVQP